MEALSLIFGFLWAIIFITIIIIPKEQRIKLNNAIEQRIWLTIIANLIFWGSFGFSFIKFYPI